MTGEELRRMREAAGLSPLELAELAGLGTGAQGRVRVSQYESTSAKSRRGITPAMERLFRMLLEPKIAAR